MRGEAEFAPFPGWLSTTISPMQATSLAARQTKARPTILASGRRILLLNMKILLFLGRMPMPVSHCNSNTMSPSGRTSVQNYINDYFPSSVNLMAFYRLSSTCRDRPSSLISRSTTPF